MRRIFNCILVVLLFGSCIEKYSNTGIDSDAEFILPIAQGSFLLGDLLKSIDPDSLFSSDTENELVFTYRNEELLTFDFAEILGMPYHATLFDETRELGNIRLDDSLFFEYIPLEELIERLSFIDEIATIPQGEVASFDGVLAGAEIAPFLVWEIEEFDHITQADFVSGSMIIRLKNEFPLNCRVNFRFFDSYGILIDEYFFGSQNPEGLKPAEMDSFVIDMAGKSLTAPVMYSITRLEFLETREPFFVDYSKGFDLTVSQKDLTLSSGEFHADAFLYQSEKEEVSISLLDSVQMHRLVFQSGMLQVVLQKQFQPEGLLTITLPCLLDEGRPVSLDFALEGDDFIAQDIDLSGKELILFSNESPYNTVSYFFTYTNTSSGTFRMKASDRLRCIFEIHRMVLSYAEGDFGSRAIDFSKSGLSLNPEVWDRISGEVFGDRPELTLYFYNSIGIPINYDFSIQASNREGSTVVITSDSYLMPFPTTLNESPVISEKVFTVDNSNILDFMRLPPNDTIHFSTRLLLNPGGAPSSPNFVDFSQPFRAGIGFRVPLLLKGMFFEYVDTLAVSFGSLTETVEKASLIFRTRNEIPLQVNLDITPFDTLSGTVTGEIMHVTLLDAAPTDELGNVTGISEAENSLVLTGQELNPLRTANALLVRAAFLSPDEGTKPAKLKYDLGFDLKVILDVLPNWEGF
ncbi:MAG TPA: hypothetical protein PLK12_11900 [Prolixibacteraceae bacterium]|nr:hypothetical protein [Prolixibacteraceae bacterium]